MMKKFIFIVAFLICGLSAQPIYNPKTIELFTSGKATTLNDTILSAGTLTSGNLNISHWRGAALLAIQSDTMAGGGTVAKNIVITARVRMRPTTSLTFNYHVPFDSSSVDSLTLAQIDSADVNNEVPIYIDLSNFPWWGYYDDIQFSADPAASADSIILHGYIKGQ